MLISPISAESIDDIVALEDGSSVNDDVPLSEDVQTLDENAQDSLKSEVQDDNLLEDDSQNEIKGSFRDLQQQIDDAEGVLNLSYDFAYSESIDGDYFVDGIYVYDKSITINGNGHKISGENSARIFLFDLYGVEATLNNLTLIGGSYDEGGAVFVYDDSTVYINNVNFSSNNAGLGGAIYSKGEVYITDSVFDNNYINLPVSAELDGGAAIFNQGNLSICNSNITNNLKDVVDESNKLAGAVATYGDTHIEDCYFADNGGSLGGAISSWGTTNYGGNLLEIVNTVFKGNVAKFGGAIYALSFNLEIDNCTFEDNLANGSDYYLLGGGAILVLPGEFDVEITNTVFSGNSAADKGGAIAFNDIDEGTIDNCTFKSNSADGGGAVYIKSSDLITISNSRFEANNASNGSAILNDGDLVLSNNNISTTNAEIYNGQGIIDSNLKVIIFGNQTISAEVGDVLALNATFTDDNGNLIYDPYFRFSINDVDVDEIDCVDGLYLYNYAIESPGEMVISTGYDYCEVEKWISIVNVPKMALTNFTISSKRERIVEGEILTVLINLNYTNNIAARASLKLYVNDDEYNVSVSGKTTLYDISGLAPGKYSIRGIFENNSMFNDANSNAINITVLIDVSENVTAPKRTESLEPVFSIDLPSDATGTFNVIIDKEMYSEGLVNGSANITTSKLSEGDHNVTVSYSGDDRYASYLKDYVLTVLVHVKYENLVVPEATTNQRPVFSINMPADATGTFSVIIDNDGHSAQLVNGSASITSQKLSLGNHTVTVEYSGDYNYAHYLRNYNLTILIVSKLDDIIVPKLTNNPEPVYSIDLPDDATGTFIVDVNGTQYSTQVVNGSAEIKVPKLDDGEYNITITYSGDGKYSSASKSSMMTVVNLKPFPEFSQNKDAEIVYSNSYSYTVLLTFHRKPAAGQTVNIIFNGISYKCITDNNGYATLNINTKIKAGTYNIIARYGNIEVSNRIKINHLIKASIKMMKSKSLKVVVTLSKVNGKFLKSKKVRIVLKGKKYVSKTNKKGVAKFKISKKVLSKLKKGKTYKCQVSYGGDKIVKKFKIKKWRLINL
ncbi:Ig-like domain repeat protein [Methanobrevibacter sp.]|uniref:Ig-like domain repeat protein n=1 Tax=Methanobrevibacter sp. TaxID=66852 RepID=UPI002E782B58|nr:Ig-like domain repeat protein [Methanobrevibacter sp.]MEE1335386.1 Ig-like domain repeat protein [Methanobrevibacter sp.]